MKKIIILLFAVISTSLYAQVDSTQAVKKDSNSDNAKEKYDFDVVREDAEFPGGKEAMRQYLQKSLRFQKDTNNYEIEGRVMVYFEISKTGKVQNARVMKSSNPLLNAEALRVIREMPDWKPAKANGENIVQRSSFPINFLLPE
jgi:TonB family protein